MQILSTVCRAESPARWIQAISIVAGMTCGVPNLQAADRGLVVDGGSWQSPTSWTPALVPGPSDSAYIASSYPLGALASGTVNLSADVSVNAVFTGSTGPAVLNLNGRTLSAGALIENGPTTINRGGGSLQLLNLFVFAGNSFTYQVPDNVSNDVKVGSGATLTLAQAMSLDGDVTIDAATIDLNGLGLSAGPLPFHNGKGYLYNGGVIDLDGGTFSTATLYLGLDTQPGVGIIQRGAGGSIHMGGVELYSGSTLSIEAGDDLTNYAYVNGLGSQLDLNRPLSLSSHLHLDNDAELAVQQPVGEVTGLTLNNPAASALDILSGSQVNLTFDPASFAGDWILRWSGDHVADLMAMHGDGRLTWNLEPYVDVVHDADDYTYVVVTVPEPASFVLLGIGALAAPWIARRRRI